jgi:hypothetical protein
MRPKAHFIRYTLSVQTLEGWGLMDVMEVACASLGGARPPGPMVQQSRSKSQRHQSRAQPASRHECQRDRISASPPLSRQAELQTSKHALRTAAQHAFAERVAAAHASLRCCHMPVPAPDAAQGWLSRAHACGKAAAAALATAGRAVLPSPRGQDQL